MQNYYRYEKDQLEKKRLEIVNWLFRNQDSDRRNEAIFAIQVIRCAQKLEIDTFVTEIVEVFCN
jgi:hypothetical protein